jgi:hypothetical protein
MTAKQVHEWASSLYPGDCEFDDWEGDMDSSVACEVLASLAMLDLNGWGPGLIPIYLTFLETPVDQFDEGYRAYEAALSQPFRKGGQQPPR